MLPEPDMGKRVAHLVTGRMLDYIQFEDDFAMVKTLAPGFAVGKPLGGPGIRAKYGVTVVCIKRRGEDFTYATQDHCRPARRHSHRGRHHPADRAVRRAHLSRILTRS